MKSISLKRKRPKVSKKENLHLKQIIKMASVNKVILVGNVGKDPEVRYLDSGIAVATVTLATTERAYTLQNGTAVPERTEWHNIIAWKDLAEVCEKYIRKGSQLYVEGKLTTKSWEKDGVKHYKTEIVASEIQMLGKKPEATGHSTETEETTYASEQPQRGPYVAPEEKTDPNQDLPF